MKYRCSNCGNLTEYKPSFCGKCGYCVIESTSIGVMFDGLEACTPLRVAFVNPVELKVANLLADNKYDIVHRTDSYTTLLHNGVNIARVETVRDEIRLQLMLCKDDREKYIDNPMFDIQKNKKDSFWKTIYKEELLDLYKELMNNCANEFDYLNSKRGK